MTQENPETPKPQLKCRDCSIDVDKLLEEAERATDATANQASSKSAVVFDLSLVGRGLTSEPKDTEIRNDHAG